MKLLNGMQQPIFLNILFDIRGDVLAGIIVSVIVGVFVFYRKKVSRSVKQGVIEGSLTKYRKSLYESTLYINHSWKLEGQSLTETVVPVSLRENNKIKHVFLEDYIGEKFSEKEEDTLDKIKPIRCVILGDAGSGKSVAIGTITRKLINFRNGYFLPVLITFNEIKDLKTIAEFDDFLLSYFSRYNLNSQEGAESLQNFIKKKHALGSLVFLVDGFDEIEKTKRFSCGKLLNDYFKLHSKTAFVMSCRTSVWKQHQTLFQSAEMSFLDIVEFGSFEIKLFISKWKFPENKSGDHLYKLLNEKPYLKIVSSKPLMLTIICFLYSQHKRSLPDNRTQFYTECVYALMEKWDNEKSVDRANIYESIDKVSILSEIAYHNILMTADSTEDFDRESILKIIGQVMANENRPVMQREKMLHELVYNAELLIEVPPDNYKFPHRTFLEFFAAKGFMEKDEFKKLFTYTMQDKGKWQETLILFCGLNKNIVIAETVLKDLFADFKNNNINTLVFRVLVECALTNSGVSERILEEALTSVRQKFDKEIIECINYISINIHSSLHDRAKKIIKEIINSDLSSEQIVTLVHTIGNTPDAEIKDLLFAKLKKIDIVHFISSSKSNDFTLQLLQVMGTKEVLKTINSLAGRGNLFLLLTVLLEYNDEEVKQLSAYHLFRLSNSEHAKSGGLKYYLEHADFSKLDTQLSVTLDNLYYEYYGSKKQIREAAPIPDYKKAILLVCYYTAMYLDSMKKEGKKMKLVNDEFDKELSFLLSIMLVEKGFCFSESNLIGTHIRATQKGLVEHFRNTGIKENNLLIPLSLIYNIIFAIIIYRNFGLGISILILAPGIIYFLTLALPPEDVMPGSIYMKNWWFKAFAFTTIQWGFIYYILQRQNSIREWQFSRQLDRNSFFIYLLTFITSCAFFLFLPSSYFLKVVGILTSILFAFVAILSSFINAFTFVRNSRLLRFLHQ